MKQIALYGNIKNDEIIYNIQLITNAHNAMKLVTINDIFNANVFNASSNY